jgi:hypothetical protein
MKKVNTTNPADGGRRMSPANLIVDVPLVVVLCLMAIALFVATRGFGGDVQKCAILASFFLGIFSLLIGAAAALMWAITPQFTAENRLRSALERMDPHHRH